MYDNAIAIKNPGSEKYSAFVSRFQDIAIVSIYRRTKWDQIDFDHPVSEYETLAKGATASARREVAKIMAAEVV
jgi:hypothetical protein